MHFTKILTAAACCLAVGLATPTPDVELVDTAHYKKNIAPSLINRITKFRQENSGTLQPSQNEYLDKIVQKAEAADSSDLSALAQEAEELFGQETVRSVFAGKPNSPKNLARDAASSHTLMRRSACECADNSDYCEDAFKCRYKEDNCLFIDDSCGFMGWYVCNGLCVLLG